MILAGIADPLRQVPDVHAILDVAEVLITENMTAEQLAEHNRAMYHAPRRSSAKPEEAPDPVGFDAEQERGLFSSFAQMAAGLE